MLIKRASCVGERQHERYDDRGTPRVRGKSPKLEYYSTICLRYQTGNVMAFFDEADR